MAALALYAMVAALAFALRADGSPLYGPAWLELETGEAIVLSLLLGTALAAATLWLTRVGLRRSRRLQALHADLRPLVHRASDGMVLAMALASGIAEELFFRGALVPLVGAGFSSVLFGFLHQVRGRGRWVWMLWATAMGLAFALLFELTGQLVGAMLAHVAINFTNLRVLRDVEPVGAALPTRPPPARSSGVTTPRPRPRSLGGILRKP